MSVIASPPPVAGASSRVRIRGTAVDVMRERDVIDRVLSDLDRGIGGWIITVNLQHLHRCGFDPEYRSIAAEADVVVADGMPLVWAARLQGTPLPERVAGSSLVETLTDAAAAHERSVFLLGGAPGAAEGAAAALRRRSPRLRLAGVHVPPLGFEDDPAEMDRLRAALRAAAPDIVYVALGSPKQERLIRAVRREMPATWWIGVGISLSFLAGDVKRAPSWMGGAGLEWAHRLVQEPRRLARRYLVEGIPFALRLLAGSALRRVRGACPPAIERRASG